MTPRNLGVLAWLGVAAPIVYVAAVIVGGASIAGYDHVRDPISSLTEAGRTGVEGIRFLFLTYNLLVAAFGAWALATSPRGPWRHAFTLLILTAVCGLLMGPFAQDPIGAPTTVAGLVHIVLAAIESLSTIVMVALSLYAFRASGWRRLGWFAAICLAVIVPCGLAAAAASAGHWQTMGLFERLTIGAFEAWLAIVALHMALRPASLAVTGGGA